MLRYFIRKAGGGRLPLAQVVLCVPSGITKVERDAVEEATLGAGARRVYLVEEPMAAAIGAGLPVAEPQGSMIIDIGGGTTEVAVISLGGIVSWQSIRVGGYEMDEAIAKFVQSRYGLLIGDETAEDAKLEAGSAWELEEELDCSVGGRDLQSGLLRRVELRSEDLRGALEAPVQRIITAVRDTLEGTPPELAADVSDRGITLAGGGALLRGIDRRLSAETGLEVKLVASPLTCVAEGAGAALDELESMKRMEPKARRRRSGRRFGRG
jgi:rod shape-determining protein MreB